MTDNADDPDFDTDADSALPADEVELDFRRLAELLNPPTTRWFRTGDGRLICQDMLAQKARAFVESLPWEHRVYMLLVVDAFERQEPEPIFEPDRNLRDKAIRELAALLGTRIG